MSRRVCADKRPINPLWTACEESGKVYGYRTLHDDLLNQSETCCPNRIACLTRIAGIKAQIGYNRHPGIYGGRPSIVIDNTLDRQFDVTAPDKARVTDIRNNEGFTCLAVVINLYSRRVISWSLQSRQTKDVVLRASWTRNPKGEVAMIQWDQSSQFSSMDWNSFLTHHNLVH